VKQVLYITTSNGVYTYREKDGKLTLILKNRHSPGFFRKRAKGYFGICIHEPTNRLIVSSRERLGTANAGKITTDTALHIYDRRKMERGDYHEVFDVHDAHQIASVEDLVFITDTGKNRVHVYDLAARKTTRLLNTGDKREDRNHVNAVYADRRQLLIGLNNSKLGDSEIIRLEISALNSSERREIDVYREGEIISRTGLQHTHDIEPFGGGFLACASSDGNLISLDDGRILRHIGDWARGIAVGDRYIYVGTSGIANRKSRYVLKKSARVCVLDRRDFNLVDEINVPGAGQLNDLVFEKE